MKRLTALILLLAVLLAGCSFLDPLVTVPNTGAPTASADTLTVHFIDVGQADCALLECDGKFMLIDGGNVEDSSLVVSYLQKQGVEELEAVICSHAHEDHVGGLPGVLAVFPTKAVYAPTRTYSSNCFDDFVYYTDQQGLTITIPKPGDALTLGSTTATVLGPVESYSETNNTSIVLMVQFGENKFLFTGDMETDAENDLLDAGKKVKADLLKVGHHGSNTSTGYRFLYEVDPAFAVISCGRDNSYGHPHDEPMSRLRDADVTIYRTDEMGTVIAVSDGKNISFSWESATARPEDPTEGAAEYYIGNINSKVLHLPSCSSLPAEKNQLKIDSYDDAIAAGYHPCSRCMG